MKKPSSFPTLRRLKVTLILAPRDCRPLCKYVVRLADMRKAAGKMGRIRKCPDLIYCFWHRNVLCVFADFAEDVLRSVEKGYDFRKKVTDQ